MAVVDKLERLIADGTTDPVQATLVLAGAVLELARAITDSAEFALVPCEEAGEAVAPCGQRLPEPERFTEPSARGTLPIEPVGATGSDPTNTGTGCACQHPVPSSLGGPR